MNDDIKQLIDLALKERFLGPAALDKHMDNLVEIKSGAKLVGFYIPFQESDGVWRTGSIYLLPQYRGKGIAKDVIREFSKDRAVRAFIEPGNAASIRAYTAAGFVRTGKPRFANLKQFDEYISSSVEMESRRKVLNWV